MKIIFLISLALLFVMVPVYGQILSDATGLVNRLDIQTDGHNFEVETVSNFNIQNFEFNKDEKKLTLFISSGLENNLGEIIIPKSFLGGNLSFYLNDQEYLPQIMINEKVSFVTLNFTGSGDNKLEIFGTTYLSGIIENVDEKPAPSEFRESSDYSLELLILAGSLVIVAAFVVMKIKKRNQTKVV